MQQMLIILNPQSGRGDTARKRDLLGQLVQAAALEAAGLGHEFEIRWAETEYPGHATLIAAEAARDGADVVVAVGGDGTVNEVINGLMSVPAAERPRFGVIPVGTGNDFARNAGLSLEYSAAVRALFEPGTRAVDVGEVHDGAGRHVYWSNTLGLGFSGLATINARQSRTPLRGFALYLWVVLKTIALQHQPRTVLVEVDDQAPQQHTISMMNLCNGPAEGGGFPVVPHAAMDDGLISFGVMRRVTRLKMLYFLPIVMAARHPRFEKFFQFGEARRMRVQSDGPLAIHIDGELFATLEAGLREFEAHIIPAALRVLTGQAGV
jgi:YegS/Rv2252/BmrU family lipid kinase